MLADPPQVPKITFCAPPPPQVPNITFRAHSPEVPIMMTAADPHQAAALGTEMYSQLLLSDPGAISSLISRLNGSTFHGYALTQLGLQLGSNATPNQNTYREAAFTQVGGWVRRRLTRWVGG